MEFRKVNITLPVQLFERSKQLVERGLYATFSDFVRDALRRELSEERQPKEDWSSMVESIRSGLRKSELAKLSEQQIINRLRRTRKQIWKERYG